ncbi:CAP domain-containing protein, partial [Archangium sp.]|uniref:CAP domain-containing protein n=1 Tax=Archangium sp. TaxID=1872627 RepID=UPI002D70F281
SFCTRLLFPTQGRYTVEIIGRAGRGPEVAALFLVDVGASSKRGERESVVEPTTVEDARLAVLSRINALRRAHGVQELRLDDTLNGVAQAYSERMAREGFFAHVAPDGSDLRGRLTSAGTQYRTAGENLGMASGPLSAHFGIEHSPGHRNNLLGTQFTHAGIGVAFQKLDGRDQAILTEVFSSTGTAAAVAVDPREEAYQALATHRASRGLPPLERNPVLERIALDHARRALELDQPKVQLPGSKVHDRVFEALDKARSASVDFYVTESPSLLPDSKSLGDRKNTVVGVGAVRGDSRTYGKGQYWMVIIYAATR